MFYVIECRDNRPTMVDPHRTMQGAVTAAVTAAVHGGDIDDCADSRLTLAERLTRDGYYATGEVTVSIFRGQDH